MLRSPSSGSTGLNKRKISGEAWDFLAPHLIEYLAAEHPFHYTDKGSIARILFETACRFRFGLRVFKLIDSILKGKSVCFITAQLIVL